MRILLSFLLAVDRLRKRDPLKFHILVSASISPIALFVFANFVAWFPERIGKLIHVDNPVLFELFLAVLTGFAVATVINPILPWLLYMPYAAAMRSMGLLRAATGPGAFSRLLTQYIPQHDGSTVRAICISGRYLFRESRDGETRPPLETTIKQHQVEALMPVSLPTNPTVMARYASYHPDYKESTYPDVETLLAEMDHSKRYLKLHGNTVIEHNLLCMWRVVLLSGHCLVQSYFPNVSGQDSELAPVFVFENSPTCAHSYYITFEQMFTLIAQSIGQDQSAKDRLRTFPGQQQPGAADAPDIPKP